MHRTFVVVTLAMSTFTLTACGGSTCDKLEEAYGAIAENAGECLNDQEKAALESSGEDIFDGCEESYDELSDAEKEAADEQVAEFAECMEELESCEEGDRDRWMVKLGGCMRDFDQQEP